MDVVQVVSLWLFGLVAKKINILHLNRKKGSNYCYIYIIHCVPILQVRMVKISLYHLYPISAMSWHRSFSLYIELGGVHTQNSRKILITFVFIIHPDHCVSVPHPYLDWNTAVNSPFLLGLRILRVSIFLCFPSCLFFIRILTIPLFSILFYHNMRLNKFFSFRQ